MISDADAAGEMGVVSCNVGNSPTDVPSCYVVTATGLVVNKDGTSQSIINASRVIATGWRS